MSILLKTKRLSLVFGTSLALISIAAFVYAQRQGTPQRTRPGQQPGVQRRPVDGSVPGVTGLTSRQRQRIITIRQRNLREIQRINTNPRLNQQQRRQRSAAVLIRQEREINRVLTPRQRQQRQRWLDEQRDRVGRGPGRTTPPPMFGITDLTTRQRQQIAEIQRETRQDMQNLRRQTDLTPAQRNARMREIRQLEQIKIMDVLNPTQREQYRNWLRSRGC